LTVANVGYVIDCGLVKQKVYNGDTGMESLLVVPISKVQAIQRTGRAGRTREGKCIRLYSEKYYKEQMPDMTVPEIKRVNLASTVLTLKNLGISDVLNFDYLDAPDLSSLELALKQLYFLRALNSHGDLQTLGIELSKFPLEPSYALALLSSHFLSCERELTTLVSVLSSENVWLNISRREVEEEVEHPKKRFSAGGGGGDRRSDHMVLVRLYEEWEGQRNKEAWCWKNKVQARALRQAKNIRE
jgi:HrpA-like RNA helicase